MANETTGAATAQAADASQPQAGASKDDGQAQAAAQTPSTDTVDVSALQRELAEARKEAAKYRNEKNAAETAKLSTDERLTKQVADLERKLADAEVRDQERTVRLASIEAASRLGFRNPDLAYRLLDRAAVQFGDDGSPKNVESLLTQVAKTDPYLVGTKADVGLGPRGTAAAGAPDMNTYIRRQAGRA